MFVAQFTDAERAHSSQVGMIGRKGPGLVDTQAVSLESLVKSLLDDTAVGLVPHGAVVRRPRTMMSPGLIQAVPVLKRTLLEERERPREMSV